jgi:hypothetical protein
VKVTNIFSGDYLFQTPITGPSIFFAILTGAFALLFLVSLVVYWRRARFAPQNPVLRRLLRRVATAGMWVAGFGLFLALMRYAGIDYFAMRIWMYLLFLVIIGLAAYYVYDFSERYPLAVWRLQETEAQRRYRPPPRRRTEPQPVRPKVRGKQRRR